MGSGKFVKALRSNTVVANNVVFEKHGEMICIYFSTAILLTNLFITILLPLHYRQSSKERLSV